MAQVKKLSVATVFGKIKLSELIEKKTLNVMQVEGIAVGQKKGITSYGEYTSLQGNFAAINPVTGEESRASVLFLPDVALLPIQTALAMANATGVEFSIMVGVKYVAEDEGHKAGGSPYEYTFEHLVPSGADDPIARIRAKREAHMLAIAPPKEVASDASTPEASANATATPKGKK